MKVVGLSLLTDENVDQQIVTYLRDVGISVKDVKEEGLVGIEDIDLLRLSVNESRVIVTTPQR